MVTFVPEGFEAVAWARYPTPDGPWVPSKVHLEPRGEMLNHLGKVGTLCGARRSRYAKRSRLPADLADHLRDAGHCSRCWERAQRIAAEQRT